MLGWPPAPRTFEPGYFIHFWAPGHERGAYPTRLDARIPNLVSKMNLSQRRIFYVENSESAIAVVMPVLTQNLGNTRTSRPRGFYMQDSGGRCRRVMSSRVLDGRHNGHACRPAHGQLSVEIGVA